MIAAIIALIVYTALSFVIYKAFVTAYNKDFQFRGTNGSLKNNSLKDIKISVIIAAKNESNNIERLIKSLLNQSYPNDRYEVIIVDDNSTDNTYQLAKSLIEGLNNFRVINATNKKFPAKKGALDYGISNSKYDNILITDCDAEPNKEWISSYANMFTKYDFIFGKLLIRDSNNLVTKITQFEKLRNSILIYAATKLNMPYCTYGPNFGYKKSAFYKVKGFANTLETLSGDDDLLLREAVKNKLNIGYLIDDGSAVKTESKKSLSGYIKQRTRHTTTSHNYLFKHKLFLGLWHLSSLIITLLFLSIPAHLTLGFDFYLPEISVIALTKFSIDIILVKSSLKSFHYKFTFLGIIIHQIIYDIMLIVNYFTSLFIKNSWDK